jgi:hypothetical protein
VRAEEIRAQPEFRKEGCMFDPEVVDRILENCSFRFRDVLCPNRNQVASITAARVQMEDADWSVVECSLLPNGEVKCAMTCLLEGFEPRK